MSLQLIEEAEKILDIEFEEDVKSKLVEYCNLLLDWNKKINLISRKSEYHVLREGIVETFSLVQILEYCGGADLIDIGTGGGIPGLIAAIMLPDSHFTLIDSIAKKIKVVDDIREKMGLENVTPLCKNLKDISSKYEGKFDTLFTRGVGKHNELMSHFLKVINDNGTVLILTGDDKLDDPCYKDAHIESNPYLESRVIVTIEK